MLLSVIICTHDPREDNLNRVLSALTQQSLPMEQWELIIIDNASTSPVVDRFNISWHLKGRHIVEDELGIINARARGISEAQGDLLLFVDDDNVLFPDYLSQALKISEAFSFLGAWGGQTIAEYETRPPSWVRNEEWRLAIRLLKADTWSNDPNNWASRPIGAGLCIRRSVGDLFVKGLSSDRRRALLGRHGDLNSGSRDVVLVGEEDHQIVEHCDELHLGWGTFQGLRLTHLISADRLSVSYFRKLIRAQTAAKHYREYLTAKHELPAKRRFTSDNLRVLKCFLKAGSRAASFKKSELAGAADALRLIKSLENPR